MNESRGVATITRRREEAAGVTYVPDNPLDAMPEGYKIFRNGIPAGYLRRPTDDFGMWLVKIYGHHPFPADTLVEARRDACTWLERCYNG